MGPFALAVWALTFATQSTDGAAVALRARERLIARRPPVAVNDEALRLERLAAGIGIDLAPPLPDRAHPLLAEKDLVQRLGLGAYLNDRVESADDSIPEPPAAIARFLSDRAEPLEEIRALLVSAKPPRWALDVAKSRAAEPDPNTEGPLVLHRVLLGKALADARAGKSRDAELWLEASWRLKESTGDRPSLTWQLIAIAVSRWEAGVLRKLPSSDPGWMERMRFAPQRERTFRAMSDDLVIGLVDFPSEELSKWSPAELLDGISRSVSWLEKQDPCAFPKSEEDRWWTPFFPGPIEKTLAGIAMPSIAQAAHRLYRLQIEGELTARVLAARRVVSAVEAGAGPSPQADSAVCAGGGRWSSLVQPDGGAHVRFDGKFEDWRDEAGIRPPLEFTIRAPSPSRP
jgi:hypothetical protein